jgi:hypothetical protein
MMGIEIRLNSLGKRADRSTHRSVCGHAVAIDDDGNVTAGQSLGPTGAGRPDSELLDADVAPPAPSGGGPAILP